MPTSPWAARKLIPMGNLEAWNALDLAVDGLTIPDQSGKGRDLTVASNAPVLQTDIINGLPALYFDGADDPLNYSGALTARHVFVLAAYEDATFDASLPGLISDLATNGMLVGQPSEDRFFNINYSAAGTYIYRKADVPFAESNQKAPMSGNFKVVEFSFAPGLSLDGIQVGQDRSIAGRLWKGWFCESLIYSQLKSDAERWEIYRYFAMKYHLWQETAAGLNIFPFQANRTRPSTRGQEHYQAEPYSGDAKVLIRGNKRREVQLPFLLRPEVEVKAAEKFHELHYPDQSNHFIFRDFNYYPPTDHESRITSPFEEQGTDVAFKFNYSFNALEV